MHLQALAHDLFHREARRTATRTGPGTPPAPGGATAWLAGVLRVAGCCHAWPSTCSVPCEGNRPRMAWASVDLPEPDSPTTPSVCPGSNCKLAPCTATNSPFLNQPRCPAEAWGRPRAGLAALHNGRVPAGGAASITSRAGLAGDQTARVGVLRVGRTTSATWPLLYQHALLHHRHAVGKAAHQVQVVRDEQHGHAGLALQVGEQIQNLRRASVTSSAVVGSSASSSLGRLARAMAIMARWRCPPESWCGKPAARLRRLGDAGFCQQFNGCLRPWGPGEPFLEHQDLGDLLANGHQRVERGHGLLEDHGDVATAHAAHLALRSAAAGRASQQGLALRSAHRPAGAAGSAR